MRTAGWLLAGHRLTCRDAQVTEQLSGVERELLSARLAQLHHALDAGFNPLNWNSLGIPEFIAACNKVRALLAPWWSLQACARDPTSPLPETHTLQPLSTLLQGLSTVTFCQSAGPQMVVCLG